MKKEKFTIVLTIIFVLGLVFIFSGCTILERIFNFGSSDNTDNTYNIRISGEVDISPSEVSSTGRVYAILLPSNMIKQSIVMNINDLDFIYLGVYDGNNSFHGNFNFDTQSGEYSIVAFIDTLGDQQYRVGAYFPEQPYGSYPDINSTEFFNEDVYKYIAIGPTPDSYEYNDFKANAMSITPDISGTTLDLTFDRHDSINNDTDWFVFYGDYNYSYYFNVDPTVLQNSNIDIIMEIYDDSGNLIQTFNDYGINGAEGGNFIPDVSGYYYLKIYAAASYGNLYGQYTLDYSRN